MDGVGAHAVVIVKVLSPAYQLHLVHRDVILEVEHVLQLNDRDTTVDFELVDLVIVDEDSTI